MDHCGGLMKYSEKLVRNTLCLGVTKASFIPCIYNVVAVGLTSMTCNNYNFIVTNQWA